MITNQACSNPKIYEEFKTSYGEFHEEVEGPFNYIKKVKTEIHQKIVTEVKNYLSCGKQLSSPSCIYHNSFTISYNQATKELNEEYLKKGSLFLFKAKQANSIIPDCTIPKDIIFSILLKSLHIQTKEDFICQIFEKIDLTDPNIISDIKENICAKDVTLGYIASNKINEIKENIAKDVDIGFISSSKHIESSCSIQ